MLSPEFDFELQQHIEKDVVVIAKYDGRHPTLTAATNVGKVVLHSPHQRHEHQAEMRNLTINKPIKALGAGPLSRQGYDILFIGTSSTLVAYDVENNQDLFYKEIADGVNVITYGPAVPGSEQCCIGGNCSLQAFDSEGVEQFWTVTGDNVSALAFCDVDDDSKKEMLVGTEDYEIRVLRQEYVLKEIAETDVVTQIRTIGGRKWGYGLLNGTVGVYEKTSRLWRIKSRNRVNSVITFDVDGDGENELVTGWDNGKIEVRNSTKGEILFKENVGSSIAAVVAEDYRLDGTPCVMTVTQSGSVKGWVPTVQTDGGVDEEAQNQAFRDLSAQKNELLQALKAYEDQIVAKNNNSGNTGIIPQDTVLNASLTCNPTQSNTELSLTTSNYSVIRAVVIVAEHLFEGESCVLHPNPPSSSVLVQIAPAKDVATKMVVKALVGTTASSNSYHVFEQVHTMPKFSMYHYSGVRLTQEVDGKLDAYIPERLSKIVEWMKLAFINYPSDARPTTSLTACFTSLRTREPFLLSVEDGTPMSKLTIQCDSMEVTGELVQDLCTYLHVNEIDSVGSFPTEMERFREVLERVDEYNAQRMKLTAEMVDASNLLKTLVVKAEDFRVINDMTSMKKTYLEIAKINADLFQEYKVRSTNHQELMAQLKTVNTMIQKAANLRVGQGKARVVTACRNAIKSNNINELFQILRDGGAAVAKDGNVGAMRG